tara:strand:- start:831 stop:1019 length:189 start_codon:yes stop_codon:yes gene_type:complete
MYKVEAYEVNEPDVNRKLIIATQDSGFKNAATKRIVYYYKQDSIFIKVISAQTLIKAICFFY